MALFARKIHGCVFVKRFRQVLRFAGRARQREWRISSVCPIAQSRFLER